MQLNSSVAAIVTGGASGLGGATVRALAAQGVKVAIFDMNEEKGEAMAKEVGGVFCKCNVTSEEEVDADELTASDRLRTRVPEAQIGVRRIGSRPVRRSGRRPRSAARGSSGLGRPAG